MSKQLLFSVTIKDCKCDAFTVGGRGGSGKDTSNTGVRVLSVNVLTLEAGKQIER